MSSDSEQHVTFREATAADLPALAELRWEMEVERHGKQFSLEVYSDAFDRSMREEMERGHFRAWLAEAGDLPAHADQAAQDGIALDNARVIFDVDGSGDAVHERGQVSQAAHRFEPPAPVQFAGERDQVRRFAPVVEVQDAIVDPAIRLAVEVGGLEKRGSLDDRVPIQQKRAEHGFLCLQIVRNRPLQRPIAAGIKAGVVGQRDSHSQWLVPMIEVSSRHSTRATNR